jgi:hypothetical protein
VLITVVYAMPALLAGALAGFLRDPALWQQVILLALPWLTIVLGTVVVMIVVGYHARDQTIDLGRASRLAIRWIPRYVWTNVHTSVVFWIPIGLLLAVRQWQAEALPHTGAADMAIDALWWLALAGLAVYLHTRTLLAPFLAVHADLPGTLAALEAWRLAGRRFPVCLATLVVGSLPVGLPLGLFALYIGRSVSGAAYEAVQSATPDLIWAGIQAIRPVLVAALYPLYHDLWQAECVRRENAGGMRVPGVARALLALTRRLPKLGRWE